ncbi:hypothetical protein ANSO36C_13790 [Nostoc cf. commune SO-36]|uniref:Homing endonuclease LAGLIDADG domain-containing protein n=1 Tax=Nostoc cf. commune SO-36 TaxID=449208 RepID=A0ABM7YY76_NOSCO|nr:hypothetical protein ANSO36C_13790 [Nostoc cf. commune SO-36]
MATSKGRKRRSEDTIPCECGCSILIYKFGIDGRTRRFASGHQFKGNTSGQKSYDLESILKQAELLRPFCACGCGEKLDIPTFLQKKGRGIISIQSRWEKHPYKKGHGIWELRTEKFLANAAVIQPNALGLIYGTLLGDCSISYPNKYSRFPRLCWTHSEKQQGWLEYKAYRLEKLRPKLRITANKGYGSISVTCNTACDPQLKDVLEIVKPNGDKKLVSMDWLNRITPEGLAWWYMDDGSLSLSPQGSPQIQLHTEGFSGAENQLIASWLTAMGYSAATKFYTRSITGKTYHYIQMGASTSRKWLADLKQYSIPTMDYKFGDSRICSPRWG